MSRSTVCRRVRELLAKSEWAKPIALAGSSHPLLMLPSQPYIPCLPGAGLQHHYQVEGPALAKSSRCLLVSEASPSIKPLIRLGGHIKLCHATKNTSELETSYWCSSLSGQSRDLVAIAICISNACESQLISDFDKSVLQFGIIGKIVISRIVSCNARGKQYLHSPRVVQTKRTSHACRSAYGKRRQCYIRRMSIEELHIWRGDFGCKLLSSDLLGVSSLQSTNASLGPVVTCSSTQR